MCHPFHHFIKEIGMLGHSVELFLGKYFFVLAGEWCWHPLWTAILLVHTALSPFYQHSLNVFDFYSTTRKKPHCLQIIFVFAIINQSRWFWNVLAPRNEQHFPVELHILARIIFLRYFLESFLHCNLSIFLGIFMWQSIVCHSHCISAVLTFKSYTLWFWKE